MTNYRCRRIVRKTINTTRPIVLRPKKINSIIINLKPVQRTFLHRPTGASWSTYVQLFTKKKKKINTKNALLHKTDVASDASGPQITRTISTTKYMRSLGCVTPVPPESNSRSKNPYLSNRYFVCYDLRNRKLGVYTPGAVGESSARHKGRGGGSAKICILT